MPVYIRKTLKKIPLIYSLNAFVKARNNTSKLIALYKHYQRKATNDGVKYKENDIVQLVRAGLDKRGIHPELISKKSSRIFWVGAHYDQDNSGFLQALRTFGEVLTFKNRDGGYGQICMQAPDRRLSAPEIVKKNSEDLLQQVESANKASPLHLLMGQMWANTLDANTLIKIQQMGIPTVNVSMDDKLPQLWGDYQGRRMGSVGLVKGLDLVLTTSPDTCLWYLVEGCPAIYWPLASDPDIFYPRSEKIYDVVFVGGRYGTRGKLVEKLMVAGIKVEAFGPGWPNGFIDSNKIAEVFGKAKIILGSGYVAYNKDILTLKLRDFDATMSGALYITNRNPDLLKLFEEGKEIECYDSVDECIRKILFYLSNPPRLQSVASAGLEKAKTYHTWKHRIYTLLNHLGLS